MINIKTTKVRKLNKRNIFTSEQLLNWKKFKNKYLNVYPQHHDYWKDGIGYETVYEVRGISDEIRENYQSVEEILYKA